MKSIKLVGLSGIIRKIRDFKKRGKRRLKISWRLKCNKTKAGVKTCKSVADSLASVSNDGIAEDGLGEVVYDAGKLGG